MTLNAFLDVYSRFRDCRPSTLDTYRGVLRQFAAFLGREPELTDLDETTVNDWLSHLSKKCSPFTVASRRMTILSIWNGAAKTGHAGKPGFVKTVKQPDMLVKTLTDDQVDAVLDASRSLRNAICEYRAADYMAGWITIALETSLRPSDMHKLDWDELKSRQGETRIIQHKTRYRRIVKVSEQTMMFMRTWHRKHGLVFPRPGSSTIAHTIKRIGKLAGIPWLNHTILRKTAITKVDAANPGSGWIFAGHRSPATTRRWYTDADRVAAGIPVPEYGARKKLG